MQLRMGERELELGGPYLGELRDSTEIIDQFDALRARMAEDGYLFLRGLHDPATVRLARQALLENLADNGQLDPEAPLMQGVAAAGARGQFRGGAKAVARSPEFLAVVEAPALMQWFAEFLGGPSLTFDYKWVRAVAPGANTGAHYDVVYMGRGTRNLYTVWTPLGDVGYDMAPLAMWHGSHRLEQVKATYGQLDVDREPVDGWFSKDPVELVDRYGGRWLTAEFAMGDALVFGMYTMHASFCNASDKLRLSCDTRYQRADEPVDERWVGENPIAHHAWGADEKVSMAAKRAEWGV